MKFVPNAISTKFARAALLNAKHSPQTLFVAGMVGMGATIVLACRATLHVEEVVTRTEEGLETINMLRETAEPGAYSEKEAHHERIKIYVHAGIDFGKLYGPAVLCGVLATSALAGSHHILTKRNAGLIAAYGALEKAFQDYRGRVTDRFGEDVERDIRLNLEEYEIEDPKDKRKKIKAKRIREDGSLAPSIYAKLFDQHNRNFSRTSESNFFFLKMQESYLNDRLHARGHLFLNEVYDALGFDHTPAGALVGWLSGENGADNYVDFGIFDGQDEFIAFMGGSEDSLWLDFNVDGVIYNKI